MSWQPARSSLLARIAIAGCVVIVTAIAFRSISVPPIPQGEERPAEEMNVRETTLRYQFVHNASSQKATAKVFCLTVDGLDPDDVFLRRFASHPVPVRKASDCNASGQGVFDRATGAQGLALHANSVTWISADEVTVRGGYYEASLSASSNIYRLRKQDGTWTVVEDRLVLIS